MNDAGIETMRDREQTLDLIYAANTEFEIKRAREARTAYLCEHPDDDEILEAGEMLFMLETTLNETGNEIEAPELARVA